MSDFPKSRSRTRGWVESCLGLVLVLIPLAGAATAQTPGGHFRANFKDADFVEVVEAVSVATGKSFIIDRRVRARVTMLSATEMSPAALYDAFLSLLPVCGFVAVPDGRGFVVIRPATRVPGLISVGLADFSSFSCVAQ